VAHDYQAFLSFGGSVLAAVISSAATLLAVSLQKHRKRVALTSRQSDFIIIEERNDLPGALKITYDGHEIDRLVSGIIEIENTSRDVVENLKIDGIVITAARFVPNPTESDGSAEVNVLSESESRNEIQINIPFLNPKESLGFVTYATGPIEFSLSARAHGTRVDVYDYDDAPRERVDLINRPSVLAIGFLVMLLIALGSNYLTLMVLHHVF
jgi:hypothetical protein